jgi:hypothetical protein
MDAQTLNELADKYRKDAVRVTDAGGSPAGHRPSFLFDGMNTLADRAAQQAYADMVKRLDAKSRKRPDDDDDEDEDERRRAGETDRRQRLARKAAEATLGTDARQLTLDELEAAAATAYEARSERMRSAWRSHHA